MDSRVAPIACRRICQRFLIFFGKRLIRLFASCWGIFSSSTFISYMDGNGRIGRFLMNVMLASGGYPWTVIPVSDRNAYMNAP
jgi:hypothetical protein